MRDGLETPACDLQRYRRRKTCSREIEIELQKRKNRMQSMIIQGGKNMSIKAQAGKIGFHVIGELTRCEDREPSHLYRFYYDEARNEYILRRGILTIIAADGTVF